MFIPILVLAFIDAQTAAALSLRAESLAVKHFRAFSASTLSAACLSVRLLHYCCVQTGQYQLEIQQSYVLGTPRPIYARPIYVTSD